MEARYDKVADAYASGPDQYSQPALACLLDLVGDLEGARALDLACGHGLVARELARRGASVVGIDLSRELLDRARADEMRHGLGIEYVLGDASDPRVLDGRQFDVIVSNFGLSDIDDLEGMSAAVSAVLVPGGRFVFSILHPCFGGRARSRVPGRLTAPTTTSSGGEPTESCRLFERRSGRTTGRFPPT